MYGKDFADGEPGKAMPKKDGTRELAKQCYNDETKLTSRSGTHSCPFETIRNGLKKWIVHNDLTMDPGGPQDACDSAQTMVLMVKKWRIWRDDRHNDSNEENFG